MEHANAATGEDVLPQRAPETIVEKAEGDINAWLNNDTNTKNIVEIEQSQNLVSTYGSAASRSTDQLCLVTLILWEE